MAVRIRVVAIRDISAQALRTALVRNLGSRWTDVLPREHNGWTHFQVSVWGTSGGELASFLADQNHPALLFTSEDGSRWYASLFRPGQETVHLLHEFSHHADKVEEKYWRIRGTNAGNDDEQLGDDFFDDDSETPPPPRRPQNSFENFAFEMRDSFGIALPESLVLEAGKLPFAEAIQAYRTWHREQLISFLADQHVNCDLDLVRDVIRWKGLTDSELYSDLGNLPRLLSAIGLGGEWDRYVEQAQEEDDREDLLDKTLNDPDDFDGSVSTDQSDDQDEAGKGGQWREDGDIIRTVARALSRIEPAPVDGGPVPLPMERFRVVQFFASACCGNESIALTIKLVLPAEESELADELASSITPDCEMVAKPIDGGIVLAFEDHNYVDRDELDIEFGPRLVETLASPPDGTTLELAFASDDEGIPPQLYRGMVKDGIWHIEATYPSLAHKVLREALALASNAHKVVQEVRDSDEAEQVLDAIEDASVYMFDPERSAIVLVPKHSVTSGIQFIEGDETQSVAEHLFRIRYREFWDVSAGERSLEEYQQMLAEIESTSDELSEDEQREVDHLNERMAQAKRAAIKSAQERKARRVGSPILQGASSRYWRSDVLAFGDQHRAAIDRFEQAMQSLKFEPLGDFTCQRFRDFALRCFVHLDATMYAVLTATKDEVFAIDFTSQFDDGAQLTTTNSQMVESRPRVGLYYKSYPDFEITDLFDKHQKLIRRFQSKKKVTLRSLDKSLLGVARLLDESLMKIDKDELIDMEEARDVWRF